ncbi:hypothetical protein HDU77_005216 [Chytriomyces hyalinus]|nr:hypothetical protein HDU77_005216 [Chytriomyces hyalinus]
MQDSIYNFENGHILQDFMFDSNDFSRGSSVEREMEEDDSDMGVLLLEPFRLEFTSANPSLRSTEEEEENHEWSSSSSSTTTTTTRRRECVARISIEKESDTEFASNPVTCHTVEMDLLTLVNVDDNAAAAAAAAGQETVADLDDASKARADASEAYSPAESTSSEWTPLHSQTFKRDSRGDHHPHHNIHATTTTTALSIYTTTATLPSVSTQHATTIESSPSSESTPTEPTSSKPLKQRRPPPPPRLSPSFSSSYSTDSRPREHECSVCHNRFLRRQDLSRHLVTHSKTKDFPCLYGCGSSFGRSDALARHMKTGKCSKAPGRMASSAASAAGQ